VTREYSVHKKTIGHSEGRSAEFAVSGPGMRIHWLSYKSGKKIAGSDLDPASG